MDRMLADIRHLFCVRRDDGMVVIRKPSEVIIALIITKVFQDEMICFTVLQQQIHNK